MNIRDLPMGDVMQLPDCCFGRRFLVSVNFLMQSPGTMWEISELGLPERCVIWELVAATGDPAKTHAQVRLALGDQLPTVAAMMDVLEPLLPGYGLTMAEPRVMYLSTGPALHFSRLRHFVESMGRRLVVQFTAGPGGPITLFVGIVVSSVPREVPDWLISGYHRSQ
jgi:hypothetical protein